MVFENLTKSLKGVTTTLTNTVSDGFDTITSPIQGISNSITGNNDAWQFLVENAWHDEYKHWWYAESKKMMEQSCRASLTTAKKQNMHDLVNRIIDQPLEGDWKTWQGSHTKIIQNTRKTIKDSKLLVVDTENKQKILGKKMITLPKKDQTQRVLSFEEFVMNCQQRLREVKNNIQTIDSPKMNFSLDEKIETIHGYSKEITKKSFGIILDHGKLDVLTHRVVKLLKKIESLQELQASSFDGESKRFDKQIKEVELELSAVYTQEWTQAIGVVKQGYATIASNSDLIHKDWLAVLGQKAQYESTLHTDHAKKTKNVLLELKTRSKKLKLLHKKHLTNMSKFQKHTTLLNTASKQDENTILTARSTRKSTNDILGEAYSSSYISYGATWIWQSHIINGLGEYVLKNHRNQNDLAHRVVVLGKQVESEYSLTQNHLKKLIRDLRKLHADINSQQSTTSVAQKCMQDILGVIQLGEEQTKTLKTWKNETKKQTSGCSGEHKNAKKSKKAIIEGITYTLGEFNSHMFNALVEMLQQVVEKKEASMTTLRDIGSNKKLSLPKTEIHEGVWKSMRVLADTTEKEIQDTQSDIQWFSTKAENKKQASKKSDKDTTNQLLSLKGVLI